MKKLSFILAAALAACSSAAPGALMPAAVQAAHVSTASLRPTRHPETAQTDALNILVNPGLAGSIAIEFLGIKGPDLYQVAPQDTLTLTPATKGCAAQGSTLSCHLNLAVPAGTAVLTIAAGPAPAPDAAVYPRYVPLPSGKILNIAIEPSQFATSHVATGVGATAAGTVQKNSGAITFSAQGVVIFNEQDALGYTLVGYGGAEGYDLSLAQTQTEWLLRDGWNGSFLPGSLNFAVVTPPTPSKSVNQLTVYPVYLEKACLTCGYLVQLVAATP